MQKREALDPVSADGDAAAPATPRASGEVDVSGEREAIQPSSSLRDATVSSEPPVPSEPSDTLLSAGKPADRLELLIEDRLALVDERLRELDARLSVLEQRKTTLSPSAPPKPWLWVAFLIGLVLVFQLVHALK